jgi:acyl carrier protein
MDRRSHMNRLRDGAAPPEDVGRDREQVLARLVEMLNDLTSECDRGFSGGIGPDTRLAADLEFDSVDVVQFALLIEERFQRRKLPFEKLLMIDGRYRDDITVGEVAEFLGVWRGPA